MPDAANRKHLYHGQASLVLSLRLFLLRTPLALPLLATTAALLGGSWWAVAIAAVGIAMALHLGRILLCTLLCAVIAATHAGFCQRHAEAAQRAFSQQDAVELVGTVTEELERGCLLRSEDWGVSLLLRGEEIPYAEGDRVRVLAAPRQVEPPLLHGMFDRRAWMRSRGLAAELDFIHGERLGTPLSWALVRSYATGIRHALARRLMPPGTADDPRRQVLCALVLGARELAEPETMLPFRRGGTLHAFAVSGMHVVMLAGLLWVPLRMLRVHPATGRCVQLVLLGCYVLITGFSVAAVRAWLMLATLLIGLSLRRRVGLANSWCFAALVILLVEPWQLSSAGFLLSFAIYAAICLGARLCLRERPWFGPDALIPPRIYTPWERWLRQADTAVRGAIIVSLVAYLVSLPLTCWLFHTLNPWSFVTNIAVTPLIPLVMLAGIAMLCLGGIPVLGAAASWCALHAAGALLAVSSSLGYLPGAYLAAETPQPPQAAMVLGTGYGGSTCVLGNPGLVINCGNELTAALLVEPALFHAGYAPAALLLPQPTQSCGGGEAVLRATWPNLRLLRAAELGTHPLQLRGHAGRYTIYPAPPELPRRPAANGAPIVRWEMPDGRCLLYVGDASLATWEQLPPDARRADILILGANPNLCLPVQDARQESGAGLILLLPSACNLPAEDAAGAPCRLLRVEERQLLPIP